MWKKIVAAVGCGLLLWSGSPAIAAETQQDAMGLYKEAYMANINDERVAAANIDLFGSNYHWELDANGKVLMNGIMHWRGSMSWDYTDKSTKQTSHEDIPFYVAQENGLLTIYSQRQGKWSKISLPGVPPELANAWQSSAADYLADSLEAIKSVTITKDTDTQQALRIVTDAGKLTQTMQKYSQSNSKLSEKEQQAQQEFFEQMVKGFAGTEVTTDWVVDKATHKTITLSTDLTPLIRGYARGVIKEMEAGKVKLNNEEREMMDSLGYYSELKFYLTYAGVDQNDDLAVPAEVSQNAVDMMNMADIEKGVAEAAQK